MSRPPSYTTSASMSRSKMSKEEMRSMTKSLLQASLSGPASKSISTSSASMSRTGVSRQEMKARADQMLRSPASSSRSAATTVSTSLFSESSTTTSTATPDSVRLRKLQLQQDLDRANARSSKQSTAGLVKRACSVDILFLLDATKSMGPYINAAKQQIKEIVADIQGVFLNQSDVRIAVVSYTDHNQSPNIRFLDFASSVRQVHQFLDRLDTRNGRDFPEDVLGGVNQALHASWRHETRCLVHIGDAPPHGHTLHDFSSSGDDYPEPGSEPHGLTYEPLLRNLVKMRVNYALLRIKPYTDRMALMFAGLYGNGNAILHQDNKYYAQMRTMNRSGFEDSIAKIVQPQFEELQLGTTYEALRHLVVNTVTRSATRTAGRLSRTIGNLVAGDRLGKPSDLSAIYEDDDASTEGNGHHNNVALEEQPPRWDVPGWLDETLQVEGFCPAANVHDADTLNEMISSNKAIKLSPPDLTIHARSTPFAKGAMRVASYAQTAASTSRFVVKSMIRNGADDRAAVVEDMMIQALCKAFALEFNGILKVEPPLDFIVTSSWKSKSKHTAVWGDKNISLEPFIGGQYVKYNNNELWVNPDLTDPSNQLAQAFSHFTFERSWGHLLVNDLQGVGNLLTDPAIQTKDETRFKLNDANLNEEGFKFFFISHECNTYCSQLGLKTNKEMFVSDDFEFRETWPTMEPTVCCSNKLCRSIVRLVSAHTSAKYPDYHWCDVCWPQLEDFTIKRLCVGPDPDHEFEVSTFFHQSQGQSPPQRCPDHVETSSSPSSPAALGESIFKRMKSTSAKGSISGRSW